jgi:hypothetical protein
MFNQVSHLYLKYANQTVDWLAGDTEERYLDNLQNKHESLTKFNWINANINYTFNSYGFRSEEFSLDPSIIFLGCSHTVGIGLPLESTWPYLVSAQLGLKRFNLGIGGTSNDTAFRLGHNWIPQLKPKLVILLSPDSTRSELHSHTDLIENLGIWTDNYSESEYYKRWITHKTNTDMNHLKNILAIKQICSEYNIKYLHKNTDKIDGWFADFSVRVDYARDLQHLGVKSNKILADYFISLAES